MNKFEVEKRKLSKTALYYTLYGDMIITNGSGLVNMICKEIVEKHYRQITLDLREVRYIDSFGIGSLIKCNSVMMEQGDVKGKVDIIINENIAAKLSTVGLDKMLNLRME